MNGAMAPSVAPVPPANLSNVTSAERPTPPVVEAVGGFERADRDALLRFLDAAAECPIMPESEILRRYNDRPDSTAFGRRRLAERRANAQQAVA